LIERKEIEENGEKKERRERERDKNPKRTLRDFICGNLWFICQIIREL
jgi:hypothetical protein